MVAWLKRNGHKRIAVLSEISPNGEEYFRFFRQECRRRGITIAAVETVSQSPEQLADNLDHLRQVNADALVYMGYGMLAAKGLLREALDELAWDPPRIMSTAFMWYLMGFDKFEGWVGIDQLDPRNPLTQQFHERFVARYGEDPPMWPNAIPVLAYDTARVLVEGLFRAPILSGPGLKAGLESIRFMPSTTGGAHTHIACAPYEHGMFRGDWLLYGRVTRRQARVRRPVRTLGVKQHVVPAERDHPTRGSTTLPPAHWPSARGGLVGRTNTAVHRATTRVRRSARHRSARRASRS